MLREALLSRASGIGVSSQLEANQLEWSKVEGQIDGSNSSNDKIE